MKVYVLKHDTVYAYGDGTKYTGITGVYSSLQRAEHEKQIRESSGMYNDTNYDIDQFEVE